MLQTQRLGQRDVAVDVPLVKFVKENGGDAGEVRLGEHLAQQNAFGLELNARGGATDGFKANLVADFATKLHATLFSDALGEQAGGETARLEHNGFAIAQRAEIEEHLGNLSGFAGSGGGGQDDPARVRKRCSELLSDGMNGQHGAGRIEQNRRKSQSGNWGERAGFRVQGSGVRGGVAGFRGQDSGGGRGRNFRAVRNRERKS